MIDVGNGVGKSEKKCDARQIAVGRDLRATIEDQARSRTVRRDASAGLAFR